MPHDSRKAPAFICYGVQPAVPVDPAPAVAPVTGPGEVTIILGRLPSGNAVTYTVTSLELLDQLADAIRDARILGYADAGMRLAVPS